MNSIEISFSLGEYRPSVLSALDTMRRDNIIARIWAKDYTVWKPAPTEITNRLGWLDTPEEMLSQIKDIQSNLAPLIKSGLKDVVLLGMGGSSLAAEVFSKIFGPAAGHPQLHILDTTDPVLISQITQRLEWEKTIFLVSSKSGTTLEISSLFQYFFNLVQKKLGTAAGSRFLLITDQGSPIVKMAEELSLRHAFLNNPNIGGRFSALSMPGIVPAAIIGVDVKKLLLEAITVAQKEKTEFAGEFDETGAAIGATMGVLAKQGRNKITFIMSPQWAPLGDWLEQLIAESTGKEGKGILPVLNEPLADACDYGQDRLFVFFQNKDDDQAPQIAALVANGHPVITIRLVDRYDLGSQMFIWEMATAVAGYLLAINPFDQPDVETTKKYTRAMIAEYKGKKNLTEVEPVLSFADADIYGNISGASSAEALTDFMKQSVAGDYVCLQTYLSPSPDVDAAVNNLREVIRQKYNLPVTYGYGPRYLHSTGQLHKGDSGNGLFIQLTADDLLDVAIPDRVGVDDSTLTFGALKAAQAKGDWQALQDAKRRAIRFHSKENPAAGLKKLTELL